MKPKIRKIERLYHRWGHRINLDAADCAIALADAGAIEVLEFNKVYQEVPNTELNEDQYDMFIMDILSDYKRGLR